MVKKITTSFNLREDILRLFFDSPRRKYHIREVASLVGVAPRTAKRYLENMREMKLLSLSKDKLYDSYVADIESVDFKNSKVFYVMKKIRDSGLVDFIERKFNYPAIILYGSASRGEDVENSDIDIFVVAKKCEDVNVDKFSQFIGREMHVMCMSEGSFKSGKNSELINNVINGIVISGFLEAFE